jgi:hypothetical protein
MPKITQSGGPSYAQGRPGEDPERFGGQTLQPGEAGTVTGEEGVGEQVVQEEPLKRPALGDVKADWVEFALKVNASFGDGDVPMPDVEVEDPSTTKAHLTDIYSGYGE